MSDNTDEPQGSIVPIDRSSFNPFPFWCPRFWAGMRMGHWLRMLARHGFRIHPSRLPWILMTTAVTPGNTAMYALQQLIFGRRVKATQPVAPPIFVLGHWRTGTTLLQELLSHDPRLASPSNYQVYATNHFLLTEQLAIRYLKFLLPKKRPMDNVTMKWDSPQEDEWARVTMGLPSPYERVAFCRAPPVYQDYLDMQNLSADDVQAWTAGFQKFLQSVTLRTGRQLDFKSPHNTGRFKLLHEMYPDAKFIHVTRDPFTFFPSTLRMHRSFDFSQSLQRPVENDGLESYVLECGKRMYDSYLKYRPEVPARQIIDVRYDELVNSPIDTMRQVYDHLQLGDVSPALDGFRQYLAPRKNYVTNRHKLPRYWRERIRAEWGQYFEAFQYDSSDGDDRD